MTLTASAAAPHTDRLVIAVHREVPRRHGPELRAALAETGLDSLYLLNDLAEYLLAGSLTAELALTRFRYLPPGAVRRRVDALIDEGHLDADLMPGPPLRKLLGRLLDCRAESAGHLWGGHAGAIAAVRPAARSVVAAAPPSFALAASFAALPEPADPFLAMHHLLTGLRYVRADAHARAWQEQGIAATDAVALTALWRRSDSAAGEEATPGLVERGLATMDPATLTVAGRSLREAIEARTDVLAQDAYAALDAGQSADLLAGLDALPGDGPA